MEEVEIIGVGPYSMKTDRGDTITGFTYHVAFLTPSARAGFVGREVKTFSVSTQVFEDWKAKKRFIPTAGDHAVIIFNRFGKVGQFQELS